MICESTDEGFPQMSVEEIPLNCDKEGYDICDEDQIQCTFGYFRNENTCIQCPQYENLKSRIMIYCLECILNLNDFMQVLFCTNDANAYYENNENSYQIQYATDEKSILIFTYYSIVTMIDGQKQLQLCEGCDNNQCKSGYFKKKRDISCYDNYILYENWRVQKCEESCIKCEIIDNQAVCIKCQTYNQVQLRSTDSSGKGQVCPNYCSACQNMK